MSSELIYQTHIVSRLKYNYYHSYNNEHVMLVIPSNEPHDPSCPEVK